MPKTIDGLFETEIDQLFETAKGYIGLVSPEKLAKIQQERNYQLQPGESSDDYCLYVVLKKIPSKDVKLVTETSGGLKVFYVGFENDKRIELP